MPWRDQAKPLPKNAKSLLAVDMSCSKTYLLKIPYGELEFSGVASNENY